TSDTLLRASHPARQTSLPFESFWWSCTQDSPCKQGTVRSDRASSSSAFRKFRISLRQLLRELPPQPHRGPLECRESSCIPDSSCRQETRHIAQTSWPLEIRSSRISRR